MINPLREFLVKAFSGFYQPRSRLMPWAWHEEQKTSLGTEESQEYAGPYDSSLAPQNRFFMEFACGRFSENIEFDKDTPADAVWRECVVMKSSQVGVTLSILLVIVWWIAEVRKNVIYAIDSAKEANRISRSRLQPLVKSCKASAGRIHEGNEGMNALTLFLMGLVVYLLGGHAEGGFQNKTATLGVIDEADYHPDPPPGQPNNVDELRSRLKGVKDAKMYVISKPKTEAHIIHREYKTGTCHKCFVPCPHCDHFQELVWKQVRYEHCKDELTGEYDTDRVKRETFYECEFCHKPIQDREKRGMLLRHRWRQTNPKPRSGKISAHLSDLYSQLGLTTWGDLACEYVAALKSITAMTTFRVNRLGLAARVQTSERKPDDLYKLRKDYLKGTCPILPVLTAMASDVQGDVRKWVRGGFDRLGWLYIIDWGYTLAFDELLDIGAEEIPSGVPLAWRGKALSIWPGEKIKVQQGIIDEGHIPTEVRRFCLRSEGLFVPAKGRGGIQVRRTVNESETECDGEVFLTYHFDDDDFKKQLYINRIGDFEKILAGKSKSPRLILPWDTDAEFIAELTSEKLKTERDPQGFMREKWVKDPAIPNDFPDAIKMLLVIWYVLGPQILLDLAAEEKAAAELAAKEKAEEPLTVAVA